MIPALLPLVLLGFHRRGENLRERILALVHEEPGVHLARAARILGVPPNSLHFHVHRLLRSGQLMGNQQGKTTHLFRPMTPEHEQTWRIALADPCARALADLARVTGDLGIEEAARILGQSRKVIRKHMLRMASHGLLDREAGHHGKFVPTTLLMEAVLSGLGEPNPRVASEDLDTEHAKRPRLPDCT